MTNDLQAKQIFEAEERLREQRRKLRKAKQAAGLTSPEALAAEHRDLMSRRSRERYAAIADIGELPAVVDSERKKACERDLFLFLTSYFPHSTGMWPFSADHRRIIQRTQHCILDGGRQVNAVYRGFAKALALDTSLPTPTGWIAMDSVRDGDRLLDEHGKPCTVLLATDIMEGQPCCRVHFDDGEAVVCSADHLWTVWDTVSKKAKLLATSEMVQSARYEYGANRFENRYSIPIAEAIKGRRDIETTVHPYVLGVWLGDGHSNSNLVSIGDLDAQETVAQLVSCGETVQPRPSTRKGNCQSYMVGKGSRLTQERQRLNRQVVGVMAGGGSLREAAEETGLSYRTVAGVHYLHRGKPGATSLRTRLNFIGVLGNKHIPRKYLRASQNQRLALLQGLMDTDGTVSKKGHCSFTTKLPFLRDDIRELLWSLGIKNTALCMHVHDRPYWAVCFTTYRDVPCFRLTRKLARLRERPESRILCDARRIVGIAPAESVPVRCIQVDSPNGLYLCGQGMIPTHNTTISELSSIWAELYGHRKYGVVLSANQTLATHSLQAIKDELESNDLLLGDYPEVCWPVRCLEGKSMRSLSQTYQGERTHIVWKADEIVLPTMPGSSASGAIIRTHGITGGIRGGKRGAQRPDFVILDDPQDDESAGSVQQVNRRLTILRKAITKLGGHGRTPAFVVNGTPIVVGDFIDQLLTAKENAAWQRERVPFVVKWPDAKETLWRQYAQILMEYDHADPEAQQRARVAAMQFYLAHRMEMDAGSVVSWDHCYDHELEASAIQHAFNILYYDGEEAFASEFQVQPLEPELDVSILTAEQIAKKTNGRARGAVPSEVEHLTAFIDSHEKLLYWCVVGWEPNFTGYVIDYGTYPDQHRSYFTLRDSRWSMTWAAAMRVKTGGPKPAGIEGVIYSSLEIATQQLLGKEWTRDDGAKVKIDRCLIDANWSQTRAVVEQFCRQSPYTSVIFPSHGVGLRVSTKPIEPPKFPMRPKPGERYGPPGSNWVIRPARGRLAVRAVAFDANHWKSFLHARLSTAMGDAGCLSLFESREHRLIAEHLTAEIPTRIQAHGKEGVEGRIIDQWDQKPNTDNHWLDCLVGCAVAASICGCAMQGMERAAVLGPPKKMLRLSDLQRVRA